MGRRTAIILIVVMLVALPALCLGGFLDHACGCGQETCGHDACASDPCDTLIRSNESDQCDLDLSVLPVLAIARHVDLEPTPRARFRRHLAAATPPRALPLHSSDVPLRI